MKPDTTPETQQSSHFGQLSGFGVFGAFSSVFIGRTKSNSKTKWSKFCYLSISIEARHYSRNSTISPFRPIDSPMFVENLQLITPDYQNGRYRIYASNIQALCPNFTDKEVVPISHEQLRKICRMFFWKLLMKSVVVDNVDLVVALPASYCCNLHLFLCRRCLIRRMRCL